MERGEIDELSDHHNGMLHQLLQSPRKQYRQLRRQQGGRQRGSHRGSQHQRKPRPHCTYDRCEKLGGHWESTCLQKARHLRGRRDISTHDKSTSPPPQPSPFPPPPPRRRRGRGQGQRRRQAVPTATRTDGAQLLQRYLQLGLTLIPVR